MSTHAREQLRDIIAAYVANLTTTSTRVYRNHPYVVTEAQLPCLFIYTTGDEMLPEYSSPARQHVREMEVIIEGRAQAKSDVDETLDDIGLEVETAIAAHTTLAGAAHFIEYQGCEVEIDAEHSVPTGIIRMTFTVRYEILVTAPGTPLLGG